MRRNVTVGIAAMVAFLTIGAAGVSGQTQAWKRFVHPSLGFSLSHPADWEPVPSQHGIIGVAILGPEIPGASGFQMNVNVVSEILPREGNIEIIEAIAERQVALVLNGYQRLRSDRTTVGGRPAILRYFTWKRNDGLAIYQMQLFTYSGRRVYVVTGTTLASSPMIAQDAGLLQRIVASFRVGR